jgi:hypothetical protein
MLIRINVQALPRSSYNWFKIMADTLAGIEVLEYQMGEDEKHSHIKRIEVMARVADDADLEALQARIAGFIESVFKERSKNALYGLNGRPPFVLIKGDGHRPVVVIDIEPVGKGRRT